MGKLSAAFAIACTVAGISAVAVTPADSRPAASSPQNSSRTSAPATFDVVEKSITDLQNAMRSGAVTSRQLVEAYL